MTIFLFVVGVALQIVGTVPAGQALWDDWREHGQGQPLIPAAARARDALTDRWRRLRRHPTVFDAHFRRTVR